MEQVAFSYLLKNEVLNMDMIETLRHEKYQLLYAGDKGVFLFHESARIYMLSVDELSLGETLINRYFKGNMGIVIHQPELEEIIKQYYQANERLECYQAVFPKLKKVVLPGQLKIKPVTLKEKDLICQFYSHDSDPDYIQSIILEGWLFGLYENEKLAGFIGRHTDGSMGLLEVLPDYKRKHYATYLLLYMCEEYQKRGWVAYSQVEVKNEASLKLHQKMGATKSDSAVIWLM